jgi:electron transfer flavoprotein alpha subunit
MTSRARWLILAFALVGLSFASASTRVHYRLLTEPGYVSACDVSSRINCSQAYLSSYGSVGGVPVALGGVAWFALVGLIAGFAATGPPAPARRKDADSAAARPAATYIFGLAAVGLVAVLYLGYASLLVLQTYCLLCIGTYVCVAGILITSGMTKSMSLPQAAGRLMGDLQAVIKRPATRTAALLYAAAVLLVLVWFPRGMPANSAASATPAPPVAVSADEEARFAGAWAQQPRVDLGIESGTARVVVVKFNDWLCPGCKAWEQTYAPVLAKVAQDLGVTTVAATATNLGKDLLPRAAALLEAGMASDVIEVTGAKEFVRPTNAGNALGSVEVLTDTVLATVRQTEFDPAPALDAAGGVETADAGDLDTLGAEFVGLELSESTRPDLSEAKVVVSGGRGMKNEENFKVLEELTDLFGGALGATRAACDAGYVANDLQVGQTGKVVAPDLYFAVGISGAIQHLAGMKSSKVIVAINKDEEAPIFQVADFGLVSTWENAMPEIIAGVKKAKG